MTRSTLRDVLILLGIGAVIFVGAYVTVHQIRKHDFDIAYEVSYEQEKKLGDLLKDSMYGRYETVKDNAADTALQIIKDRLVSVLDSTHYRYDFVIIDEDEINAFTIPGGNIFVFSGLIEAAESPEEVAAVLAHEIGHAEKRHVIKKIVKEMSVAVIVAVVSGNDPSVLVQMMQHVISTSFSRDQETEADEFALTLLENAKISPKNLGKFFERLEDRDLTYNENLELLMTHPHNEKRIDLVRHYKTRNDFKQVPFDMNWERVKRSLTK